MRNATARISILLVLALLLQLAAAPLGFLLTASAADTKLVEKVLYEEDFSEYASATPVTIPSDSTVAGWKQTQGTGNFNLANGKLNAKVTTSGYKFAQLYAEGSENWQNYTLEYDMVYNDKTSNWFGVAYNVTDYNGHEKVGINGTDSYFLNGKPNAACDALGHDAADGVANKWLHNTGINQSTSTKLSLAAKTTYRVKLELSNQTGTAQGTAKLSVATYGADGELGEYAEIVTVNNIDTCFYKGTIGVVSNANGAADFSIDNIKVYQMVEEEVKPTEPAPDDSIEILYEEDFDGLTGTITGTDPVNNWALVRGTGTFEFKEDALYINSNAGNAQLEVKVEGSDKWSNYVYETDFTYLPNSGWTGIAYNANGWDSHQKAGVHGTDGYFLNGHCPASPTADKNGWVNDGAPNNSNCTANPNAGKFTIAVNETFRLKVETSNMDGKSAGTASLSIAKYGTDGKLGDWTLIHTATNIDSLTWQGSVGVACNSSGSSKVKLDNVKVYKVKEAQPEEPDDGLDLPEGMVLYFQDDFSSYAEGTVIGTTAVGAWKQADGNETATVTGGALNLKSSGSADGKYSHWFVTVAEDKEKKIPASSEWTNYTFEYDLKYNSGSSWVGFMYNYTSVEKHHKANINPDFNYFINARDDANKASNNNYNFFHDSGSNQQSATKSTGAAALAAAGITGWGNDTWRVKFVSSGFDGTNKGTGTLYVAKYTDGVLGDWIEIQTVNNLHAPNYKGTIGVMNSANPTTNVVFDNILVYGPALADESEKPTEPTEPTEPSEPVAPEYIRVDREVLYEENFDSYKDGTAGKDVENAVLTGAVGFTKAEVKDGALTLVGSSGNYDYNFYTFQPEGSAYWNNYTVEIDVTYNNLSRYTGVLFNYTNDNLFQKGGLYGTAGGYFINGMKGTSWQNDGGANNSKNPDFKLKVGDKVRIKIVTENMTGEATGTASMYAAYYGADGKLGEYGLVQKVDNIIADTYWGTTGLFVCAAESITVDNLIVYKEKKVLYEENFDGLTGKITDTTPVNDWALVRGSGTFEMKDGGLYIDSVKGNAQLEVVTEGSYNWSNYTFEADWTYLEGTSWMGIAYNANGWDSHQKAGVWGTNGYFLNGHNPSSPSAGSGGWVNDTTVDATKYAANNSSSNVVKLEIGKTFRIKVVTSNMTGSAAGTASLYIAYYDDAGNLGNWKLVQTVNNIDATTYKGTIGVACASSASSKAILDNIIVYETVEEIEPPKIQASVVSDIYDVTPDTGIVNPPVVAQYVVNNLPEKITGETAALLIVNIDEDLNILAADDETVLTTMESFLSKYKARHIPAFIVSSAAEAEALATFTADNELIDIYVIADSGELTTSVVEATSEDGKDITTATCDGANWVKIAHDTDPNLRGALIISYEDLNSDLNADGTVDYYDLAVLCHMAANDTGVTQLFVDGMITVDQMNYFNNHAISVWGVANDAAEVYSAISCGWFGVIVEQAATAFDVYTEIGALTLSGRPMPITHRGAHMNYGAETETVIGLDGNEFVYYGETENSVAAFKASWNYFGVMGSEIDIVTTAACSGDDATCTHTIIEGAGACNHTDCELCKTNIILEHDKNLPTTTNFNAMKAQYPEIFNHGVSPVAYTVYELKMLTLTGKGNNKPSGELKLATFEEALASTEDYANGNYVYYCHINSDSAQAYFNEVLENHPEYVDNVVIFHEVHRMGNCFNPATLTAAVPITVGDCNLLTNTVNQPYMQALEDMIELMNQYNAHFLGYHYRMNTTDRNDDFYYQTHARGIQSYHSVTTGVNVFRYHISENGAIGCLIEQPKLVDDWHYFVEAPTGLTAAAGAKFEPVAKVRTIVGDKHDSENLFDVPVGVETISGPEFYYSEQLGAYTTDESGKATVVFFYEADADGGTYRVYSEAVEVNVEIGVTGVEISKSALELTVGQQTGLAAVVFPVEAENKAVTWTSSNETVATVNSNGIVTAMGEGEAVITVTTVENGFTASCIVTVTGEVSDPEAAAVIEAIEALGEVTIESKEALADAREAYEALSAEDKALVSNYADLLAAEAAYAAALKDAATTAAEKVAAAEAAVKAAEAIEAQAKLDAAEAEAAAEAAAAEAEAALADKTLSDEAKAAAVAKAEAAAKAAEEAEAAAEAATVAKAVAEIELAKIQAEIEAAEAAKALAEAKYEALNELNAAVDALDVPADKAAAVADAKGALVAAIANAESLEELDEVIASIEDVLDAAMEGAEPPVDEPLYTDVEEGAYYEEAVYALTKFGLLYGIGDNKFGVGQKLTRGQLVAIIARAGGDGPDIEGMENPFTDLDEDAYYFKGVVFCYNLGIVAGTSETTFDPDAYVTREQFAAIMYRLESLRTESKITVDGDFLADFDDAEKISDYAVEAMNWAVSVGLIKGTATTILDPLGNTTREQAAAIIYRFVSLK